MSPELEWTVEYETLPPDEPPWGDPDPPPPRPRPPRWLWLAIGLVVILSAGAAYLYFLGGRIDPRPELPPETDAALSSLKAAIALEVDAFNRYDREIYEQLQASQSHRQNPQPPPERWFQNPEELSGETPAGQVELLGVQLNNPDSGYARVQLTWDQTPYQLYWYYKQEEGRWLHADWQPMNLVQVSQIESPHVSMSAHELEHSAGTGLVEQVESFLASFCELLPCPAEPISITIEFDTTFVSYSADNLPESTTGTGRLVQPATGVVSPTPKPNSGGAVTTDLHYRLPSPLRIRWPADDQPEPLVLASLGRHIAYDLFVRGAVEGLDDASRSALTLTTFWLTHHLLDLPPLPGTGWLERAAGDDLALAIAFVDALRSAVSYTTAFTSSFPALALASTVDEDDYFGWLTQVADGTDLIDPSYHHTGATSDSTYFSPPPRYSILDSLDLNAEPWAPAEWAYRRAIADVVLLTRGEDWAIATAELGQGWIAVYFFDGSGDHWALRRLEDVIADDSRFGEEGSFGLGDGPLTITDGPLTITYWLWDEPFIEEIHAVALATYESTIANFQLDPIPLTLALVPVDNPVGTRFEPEPDALMVASPAWRTIVTAPEINLYDAIATNVIWYLMQPGLPPPEEIHGWALLMHLMIWQGEEIAAQFGIETGYSTYLQLDAWEPPLAAAAPGWPPLSDLWATWADLTSQSEVERWYVAGSVVSYILEAHGPESAHLMFEAFSTAGSMGEWITAATGQPLERFEPAWREWVVDSYGR